MPRVTYNRLSKKKSTVRRKRTGVLTRAKYKPRTTTANRSLIKGNALAIRSIKRLMPPPIYTDFQYSGAEGPITNLAPNPYFTLITRELMTPNLWASVLRQDVNVEEASSTLVRRMQLNLRYSLGAGNWCQITTFVVSIRKDAANRVITQAGLNVGEDYILSQNAQNYNFNPRLNPAVFKVHYVRNVSLMSGAWLQPAFSTPQGTLSGNPGTTYGKGQVNMKLDYRIRQPLGSSWRGMNQEQLPPHQRLYLLVFFKGQQDEADQDPARIDFDALYTCYNAS